MPPTNLFSGVKLRTQASLAHIHEFTCFVVILVMLAMSFYGKKVDSEVIMLLTIYFTKGNHIVSAIFGEKKNKENQEEKTAEI